MKEKKTLVEWVKGLIRRKAPDLDSMPQPPSEKAITTFFHRILPDEEEIPDEEKLSIEEKLPEDAATSDKEKKSEKEKENSNCCSFAVKRNIVNSLHEIKKFAEENNLAGTMIRALLTLLAEMALGALKGKVSSSVLDSLLKVFNYETAIADAFSRGEIAGRNAKIEKEYFPAPPDPKTVPEIPRRRIPIDTQPTIFKIAKGDIPTP